MGTVTRRRMLQKFKSAIIVRSFYLAGGLAAVLLVFPLTWLELTAPLDARLPVPSPDGKYFAYFNRSSGDFEAESGPSDLIVSTSRGRMMARFALQAGSIVWSSSGNLFVETENPSQATLLAEAERQFLVLTSVAFIPGSEPRWSRDGTKLAYVRPAAAGPELAVYDLQQTQAATVPLPADFQLGEGSILSWSPGSEEVYFQSIRGQDVVLNKVEVLSGEVQSLATLTKAPSFYGFGLLSMSPEGSRIYLPRPLNSVIDAQTSQTVWKLDDDARPLWSPWSADGRRLFYARRNLPGQIYVHDFDDHTDQTLLSHCLPNGFFALDEHSYFFRKLRPEPEGFPQGIRMWLEEGWGWQHVDMVTKLALPMGRQELWPREQTTDGSILMSRDDYARVRYGLYDPNGRALSEYEFPTEQEDLIRHVRSHALFLLTIVLYGLLAFFVYLKRPESAPARALYILSLNLMVLFTSLSVALSLRRFYSQFQSALKGQELVAGGSYPMGARASLFGDQLFVSLVALCLVPPALLRFALVFPEKNRFLAGSRVLRWLLYGAAFLPLLAVARALALQAGPPWTDPTLARAFLISGPIVAGTVALALLNGYRHPPDRRARAQVRWVSASFSVPPLGLAALWLAARGFDFLTGSFGGASLRVTEHPFGTAAWSVFFLFPPLAISYALLAHKLFDIQLLFRRTARYVSMAFVAAVVFGLFMGGLSWTLSGSVRTPPKSALVASALLTAMILAPLRRSLEHWIDRTIDRTTYNVRETLENFASSLPTILDRETLEARLSVVIRGAMDCRRLHLFVLDRRFKKLRLQAAVRQANPEIGHLTFDPAEPLCQFLLRGKRPFEVEVSPYKPELIPIFRGAGDRLSKLEAAVVVGLERRAELVGMMVVGVKVSDEFYNSEDLELLMAVAQQAAIAIENTDLLEEVAQERDVASEVPAQLFPGTIPRLSGCQIAGRCLPVRSVSGDYYDFLELPGRRVGLAIGDVSGEGASAPQLMANLQSLLRTQAPAAESLAELVRRINRQLYHSSQGAKYCTFFYGVYHETHHGLEFVNAGHNPPLLVTAAKTRLLESTGVPLGLFSEVTHEVRGETLDPGTLLVLYSDGVIDARNPQGEAYGVDRLASFLSRPDNSDAAGLVERILKDVSQFSASTRAEDDQTVVVLKVVTP